MSQPPASGPAGRDNDPQDPFSEMLRQLLGGGSLPPGFDPSQLAQSLPGGQEQLAALMAQVQRMMAAPADEPVNWELAQQTARTVCAAQPDPMPSDADGRKARDTMLIADTWLAEVTAVAGSTTVLQTWSRAEWVEATLPVWQRLAGPVAAAVSTAMADAMQANLPAEMSGFMAGASGMLKQIGGGVFGSQVGHAVGKLAAEVLGTYDIGLPLTEGGDVALVTSNVAEFTRDLEQPDTDVLLYLALRENAHHRLYEGVPWLRGRMFDAIEAYARGITIDTEKIEQAVRGVDPQNPEAMTEALEGGLLNSEQTPEQKAALERLELLLALIEGWVDHVTHTAAANRMPAADALRETMRRRRAAGGPAEHTLASLVGLQLRPRRLRDAAALWQHVAEAEGQAGRDALWAHPDLLPTLTDLDDPESGANRLLQLASDTETVDLDAELRSLLAESESGPASGGADTESAAGGAGTDVGSGDPAPGNKPSEPGDSDADDRPDNTRGEGT